MADRKSKRDAIKRQVSESNADLQSNRLVHAQSVRKAVADGAEKISIESSSMFQSVLQKPEESDIQNLFNMIDQDSNGFITKDEFRHLYTYLDQMGVPDGSAAIERIMGQYNMLADDKLSYNEFAILILKIALW